MQPVTGAHDVYAGNPPLPDNNTYGDIGVSAPTVGSNWTSELYALPATSVISCINALKATPPSNGSGWYISDQIVVIQRAIANLASFYGRGGSSLFSLPSLNALNEYFLQQSVLTVSTTPTDILWGKSVLSLNGGADRSYPAGTATGTPQTYTPSASIQFSVDAPGFSRARFSGYYRPCVLMQLTLGLSAVSGAPTSATVSMYINGVLVRTTSGLSVTGSTILYCFSIKGLGDFTSQHPPDNNSADSYNGWSNPAVSFKVSVNAGSVTVNTSTKLADVVLNYPV